MSNVYVHPEMAAIMAAGGPAPDYPNMNLAEARPTFVKLNEGWNADRPAVAETRDLSIERPWGKMRAKLLRPTTAKNLPVLLFVHGGGWTFGSIDSHLGSMTRLAVESGAAVLGIDYRLAPEHPFPAAIDDTRAALDAIAGGLLGDAVDVSRIAVGGDSAGAGITLLTLAGHEWRKRVRAACLFYGCFTPMFDTASHAKFGPGGYGLTSARMRWYWDNWRGPATLPDLTGLPKLYLSAAALDPLRDETPDLANKLAEAGNDVRLDVFAGVCHGFMQMSSKLEPARKAHRVAGQFLAEALK